MSESRDRLARYSTYALAAATVVSDAVYLLYLRGHSMSRLWSGINAELLGLFMLAWAMTIVARGRHRWGSPVVAVIGLLNMAVGILFFL